MKRNWWKILSVVLLLFTFTAGILIPLSPGIVSVTPSTFATSEKPFTVNVFGYNTRFKDNEKTLSAWLTNWSGGKPVNSCAEIRIVDNTHLELDFPPLAPLDSLFFGLTVYNDADGRLYLDQAIASTDTARATVLPSCSPVVANEKQDHYAFPFRHILYESMRNLFFHVPMWFTMIGLLSWALYNNLKFLRGFDMKHDKAANEAVNVALLFGVLGLITGSLWARPTWLAWWVDDVKLNGTAITMLAYLAYAVLRNAIEDEQKRARVSAIYSIFAFVMMLVLIGVLPRMADSLHPGNGGNSPFSTYDLDNTLRPVFYSAVAGWLLLGFWIFNLRLRITRLRELTLSA